MGPVWEAKDDQLDRRVTITIPDARLPQHRDFGVAAGATEAAMTTSGVIMGPRGYIARERGQGKPATPACDVYSVGVVLYEMLAGRPPYSRDTAVAVASAHVHGEPEPLSRAV